MWKTVCKITAFFPFRWTIISQNKEKSVQTHWEVRSELYFSSRSPRRSRWDRHIEWKQVGSGRCHHCSRSLPSLAAAAANHGGARCQPKSHGVFPLCRRLFPICRGLNTPIRHLKNREQQEMKKNGDREFLRPVGNGEGRARVASQTWVYLPTA